MYQQRQQQQLKDESKAIGRAKATHYEASHAVVNTRNQETRLLTLEEARQLSPEAVAAGTTFRRCGVTFRPCTSIAPAIAAAASTVPSQQTIGSVSCPSQVSLDTPELRSASHPTPGMLARLRPTWGDAQASGLGLALSFAVGLGLVGAAYTLGLIEGRSRGLDNVMASELCDRAAEVCK